MTKSSSLWFFAGATFLLSPSAIGHGFTVYGLIMLFVVVFAYLAGSNFNVQVSVELRDKFKFFYFVYSLFWMYMLAISILSGKSDLKLVIQDFIITSFVVVAFSVILINRSLNLNFFYIMAKIIALLGYSHLVSSFMLLFFDVNQLAIFNLPIKNYDNLDQEVSTGTILFPLSLVYGTMNTDDFSVQFRFSGFYREAGIFQAICCFFYIYLGLSAHKNLKYFYMIGLAIGCLSTLSTIGIAMLFYSIALIYFLSGRNGFLKYAAMIAGGVLSVYLLFYAPLIGVNSKSETHAGSIVDRSDATSEVFNSIDEYFVGDGFFSTQEKNKNINMLGAIRSTGVVGFLLSFLLISGFRGRGYKSFLVCSPLLVTALFAQPMATAPIIYVLTMVYVD